jgi:hypothetical protein
MFGPLIAIGPKSNALKFPRDTRAGRSGRSRSSRLTDGAPPVSVVEAQGMSREADGEVTPEEGSRRLSKVTGGAGKK